MSYLNPYSRLQTIHSAQEILELAQNRSYKLSMKSSLRLPRLERTRIREIARVQEFAKQVKSRLRDAVEGFPTLEKLHPFYYELTDLIVGVDKLKQALGAVYNSTRPIENIADRHIAQLKTATDIREMKRARRAAKGRISSIVRATAGNLDLMIEARRVLVRLPGVNTTIPTIVCAGFPNVGKSTLVRAVSTAEPEIAYYPFTTKEVIVGHLTVGNQTIQIVDTPGILDRPMSQRNEIEKKAIAAVKYLANVILFMLDASETCGWTFEEQMNLYSEVKRSFPLTPTVIVLNKVDITPSDHLAVARAKLPGAFEIVASSGTGVAELMQEALSEVDLEESTPTSSPD
ncbi:MAG: 50S ribosome-binding GTPase [Candidatus Thorarchaeota archaeon]|nr:50S ribosome-binding GTPase [Candidatus Thorarchaeota archaeon]